MIITGLWLFVFCRNASQDECSSFLYDAIERNNIWRVTGRCLMQVHCEHKGNDVWQCKKTIKERTEKEMGERYLYIFDDSALPVGLITS